MSLTITESLEEKLTQMEKNKSPFEVELRERAMTAMAAFSTEDRVGPCLFSPTNACFEPKDSVVKTLPTLVKRQGEGVLEGISGTSLVTGKRVAVLFSGGPASGGHNVLVGLLDVLGTGNTLLGIRQGPKGLLEGNLFEITLDALNDVKNLGGFDFLGSDRTKIKTEAQFEQVRQTVQSFRLDGLIVVGGDDSNTNAAFLAEFLAPVGCTVVGVPKTIDGDLQVGSLLPISFGFDTATKTYAELVGNILQDTPSSRKYWHFVKLMGRSASHVALEVALQTHPALTLISEEIAEKKLSLNHIVEEMARTIALRAGNGIYYGVAVIPEGLIEFIPEFKTLIAELNDIMVESHKDLGNLDVDQKKVFVESKLTAKSGQLMGTLPEFIKTMLLLDRDSHGNLQVSQVPTEGLLVEMLQMKLSEMKTHPSRFFGADKIPLSPEEMARFKAFKFAANSHFFGYEGRCGAPTVFDATYTYNLGLIAGSLVLAEKTGYMAAMTDFDKGGRPLGLPMASLLSVERRHGKDELVIEKALVQTQSNAFRYFESRREAWAMEDCFSSPGPRQLWGPTAQQIPMTVALNQGYTGLTFQIS